MSIINLFTRTFSLIFRSAALWVVALSMLLIQFLFGRLVGYQNAFMANLTGLVNMAAVAILVGAVVQIFDDLAEGRSPSIIDGFRRGGRIALPLLLLQLVWQVLPRLAVAVANSNIQAAIGPVESPELLMGSALLFLVSSSFLGQGNGLPAFLGQGVILLAILVAGAFAIGADRAVALEGLPVPAALGRGWNLLRSRFASYLKVGLAAALVTLALGLLMAALQSLLVGPAAFGVPVSEAEMVRLNANPLMPAATALNVAFNTLALIFLIGVWTLAFRGWQGKD